MSENVAPIRPGLEPALDAKTECVAFAAQEFEAFTEHFGHAPVNFVVVLLDDQGNSRQSAYTTGSMHVEAAAALAAVRLLAKAAQ